jgi:hypothetical protein
MTNKLKSVDTMPGNVSLPLIGNTISVLTKLEQFYWEQHQKYGCAQNPIFYNLDEFEDRCQKVF